jgi:hypothetical protein
MEDNPQAFHTCGRKKKAVHTWWHQGTAQKARSYYFLNCELSRSGGTSNTENDAYWLSIALHSIAFLQKNFWSNVVWRTNCWTHNHTVEQWRWSLPFFPVLQMFHLLLVVFLNVLLGRSNPLLGSARRASSLDSLPVGGNSFPLPMYFSLVWSLLNQLLAESIARKRSSRINRTNYSRSIALYLQAYTHLSMHRLHSRSNLVCKHEFSRITKWRNDQKLDFYV